MFEVFLSTGGASIIAALFTGVIAWFVSKRKHQDSDREYHDVRIKLLQLQNARLSRRNGKLVALNMIHASHQITHKDQYNNLLSLCEDKYVETAKKRLREYAESAEKDAAETLSDLDEISDISEVIHAEEVDDAFL